MGILEEKIKKLLALSSSSYEEEAKAAMLKAQELMAKHNISMSTIEGFKEEDPTILDQTIDTGRKTIPVWHASLASVIANNFRCTLYARSTGNYSRSLNIFGLTEDVQTCTAVINFAFQSLDRCWKNYIDNRFATMGRTSSRKQTEIIKNNYMSAFIQGIKAAFAEQVKTTAIVLVQHQLVRQHERKLGLSSASRTRKNMAADSHAQSAGYRDGKGTRKDAYITA